MLSVAPHAIEKSSVATIGRRIICLCPGCPGCRRGFEIGCTMAVKIESVPVNRFLKVLKIACTVSVTGSRFQGESPSCFVCMEITLRSGV